MSLLAVRKPKDAILELPGAEGELLRWNHVFEPEYHQKIYVEACEKARAKEEAFQLSDTRYVKAYPHRGVQPRDVDDEEDPESLEYEGMVLPDGTQLDSKKGKRPVCALKSVCVRAGFIDVGTARAVSRDFYEKRKAKAGVQKGDLLNNSTGDGTIGRAAVYSKTFPTLVDGHITIVRFKEDHMAWYVAAYLLSQNGDVPSPVENCLAGIAV